MPVSAFEALRNLRKAQSDSSDSDLDDDDDLPLCQPLPPIQLPPPKKKAPRESVLITKSKTDTQRVHYTDSGCTVKLLKGDHVLIKGKYKLKVVTGSVTIDSALIEPEDGVVEVDACSLTALPVIYSDRTSEFEIHSWFDGSYSIGDLYPQVKNVYETDTRESFRVLFNSNGEFGTTIPKSWKDSLSKLKKGRVLMIGGKNSGKSTFLRLLLNKTVKSGPVRVLDLDCGQTEYSYPESISLTRHTKPIFGIHFPYRHASSDDIQSFIGFNNPQRQPMRYLEEMEKLASQVTTDDQLVLINTPGWIKGWGVEIFRTLTEKLHITHLVFFSDLEKKGDRAILDELTYDNLVDLDGFHLGQAASVTRYSAAQIRNFKMLCYFHYNGQTDHFDFSPLLATSPYRVSYPEGISMVCLLEGGNINQEDICECLETQVVALYLISKEDSASFKRVSMGNFPDLAVDCVSVFGKSHKRLLGLGLVHSVDLDSHLINLYTPADVQHLSLQSHNLVLVKGRTEYPAEEIYPAAIYGGTTQTVPYVSFTDVGKGSRPVSGRRNIKR